MKNGMLKSDILAEIKMTIPVLIKKEHEFRVAYIRSRYSALRAGSQPHSQLEENSLWMSLYSHINWLAHFSFLKTTGVDKYIPDWMAEVFDWPREVAQAFWSCGRDPIAHTGNRSQGFSQVFGGVKYYIGLQLDDPKNWNTSKGYLALPPMKKDIGGSGCNSSLSAQQYIFFYVSIEDLLVKFTDNIEAYIKGLDYTRVVSLNRVCHAFYFIQDDGSLFRMADLLRVYKYAE